MTEDKKLHILCHLQGETKEYEGIFDPNNLMSDENIKMFYRMLVTFKKELGQLPY